MLAQVLAASAEDCYQTTTGTHCDRGTVPPGSFLVGALLFLAFWGYIGFKAWEDKARPAKPRTAPPTTATQPMPVQLTPQHPRVQRRWLVVVAVAWLLGGSLSVFLLVLGQAETLRTSVYTVQGRAIPITVDCGSKLWGNTPTDAEFELKVRNALFAAGLASDTEVSLSRTGPWGDPVFWSAASSLSSRCDEIRESKKTTRGLEAIGMLIPVAAAFVLLMRLAYRPRRSRVRAT